MHTHTPGNYSTNMLSDSKSASVVNAIPTFTQNTITSNNFSVPPTPPHTGYTRRAKLGDSRSTGRLAPGNTTQRSMTRLNLAGGSVGGLHKSMTKLSSSQQINQNGTGGGVASNISGSGGAHNSSNSHNYIFNSSASSSYVNGNFTSQNYSTQVPLIGNNIIVTGHHK